jgi:phosphatidylserine/phosphatidylglycerophosphate/cardiolipin synthase-like enzyme
MAPVYGERPPWHDVQGMIRGPAVGDVEAVFRERWEDPAAPTRNPVAACATCSPGWTTRAGSRRSCPTRRRGQPRRPAAAHLPLP